MSVCPCVRVSVQLLAGFLDLLLLPFTKVKSAINHWKKRFFREKLRRDNGLRLSKFASQMVNKLLRRICYFVVCCIQRPHGHRGWSISKFLGLARTPRTPLRPGVRLPLKVSSWAPLQHNHIVIANSADAVHVLSLDYFPQRSLKLVSLSIYHFNTKFYVEFSNFTLH